MVYQSTFTAFKPVQPLFARVCYNSKNHENHSVKPCVNFKTNQKWRKAWVLLGLVASITIFSVGTAAKAKAQDCFPNHLAPRAMQEVRQLAEQQSYERTNVHWYSTSDKEQVVEAYRILARFRHEDSVPKEIEQIHLLNIENKGFILLITDAHQTCGFKEITAIRPELGRQAISAANEVLELQRQRAAVEKENRYPAKTHLMDLRNILSSYDLRKQVPEYFCEDLDLYVEYDDVPKFEDLKLNPSLSSIDLVYHYIPPHSFHNSKWENFFKNAVGGEDAGWFNRIQHVILIPNNENTDIILGNHQHLCGFGSFASFPAELVNSWFEPLKGPKRSTQPGDPIYNMTDEERRAFQMMQGIFNGENPEQGFKELFSGMK